MQGVLPGQGFDCLLGEVSTLQLSSATTLPIPGTCCLWGHWDTLDGVTDETAGTGHGAGCSWGLWDSGRSLLLPRCVMLWEGLPFGFVKPKGGSGDERLLRLEGQHRIVLSSWPCYLWVRRCQGKLLDEPREVGTGRGHLLAAAQRGYRAFPRASKSDPINPQGRKTPAKRWEG